MGHDGDFIILFFYQLPELEVGFVLPPFTPMHYTFHLLKDAFAGMIQHIALHAPQFFPNLFQLHFSYRYAVML